MKVTHLPVFEDSTWQQLLLDELEDRGIDVETAGKALPFYPWLAHIVQQRPDAVHIHWTHPYFLAGSKELFYDLPGSRAICWLAGLVFIAQLHLLRFFTDRVVWTVHNRANHERRYPALDYVVNREVGRVADTVQVWDEQTEIEARDYFHFGEDTSVEQVPHGSYRPAFIAADGEGEEL